MANDFTVNRTAHGDALSVLKTLPDESVDMIITSPPYWSLRDYGTKGQLGVEKTFETYIEKLCTVFDEAKRVLKKGGSCWVNMGDTYGGSGQAWSKSGRNRGRNTIDHRPLNIHGTGKPPSYDVMPKSLLQIPSRFAIEMSRRGWILRNEIIWHKPNSMPSSAKDRFTVDFEKLFFFTKSKKYYFDPQYEPYSGPLNRWGGTTVRGDFKTKTEQFAVTERAGRNMRPNPKGRNKRCVWSINTKSFPKAHFAVYPPALIETPIKAGCPEMVCSKCGKPREKVFEKLEISRKGSKTKYDTKRSTAGRLAEKRQAYRKMGLEGPPASKLMGYSDCKCKAKYVPGIVLDPFMGSGTTALVARELGRDYFGIELNKKYIKIVGERLKQQQPTLWEK